MSSAEPSIERANLVAEIYRDAAELQVDGRIPPGFEDELHDAFVRVAPAGAIGGDGSAMLARAEAAAAITPHAPVDARSLPGTLLKRLVRKLTYWYASWIADQVAEFAASIVRAARLLERRIAAVERGERAAPSVDAELARLAVDPLTGTEIDRVLELLAGPSGTVVVADALAAPMAERLRAHGTEVTVVDPRRSVFVELAASGHQIVCERVEDHLAGMGRGAAGAVVLAGFVERTVPEVLIQVVDHAATALAAGGRLAVVSADPSGSSERSTIAADLSGTRPFHPSTWSHLLGSRGFVDIEVEASDGRYLVVGRRG